MNVRSLPVLRLSTANHTQGPLLFSFAPAGSSEPVDGEHRRGRSSMLPADPLQPRTAYAQLLTKQ